MMVRNALLISGCQRQLSATWVHLASAALNAANADVTLHLRADDRVPYGPVAKVMAAIEHAGISRVSVLMESE